LRSTVSGIVDSGAIVAGGDAVTAGTAPAIEKIRINR
jgi:hypothetical protein